MPVTGLQENEIASPHSRRESLLSALLNAYTIVISIRETYLESPGAAIFQE